MAATTFSIGAANNDGPARRVQATTRLAGSTGNDTSSAAAGAHDQFRFDQRPQRRHQCRSRSPTSPTSTTSSILKHAIFHRRGHWAPLGHDAVFQPRDACLADAQDRIVYDRPHGRLYYDRDGTGAHAKVLFAILANHAALSNVDFVVIA